MFLIARKKSGLHLHVFLLYKKNIQKGLPFNYLLEFFLFFFLLFFLLLLIYFFYHLICCLILNLTIYIDIERTYIRNKLLNNNNKNIQKSTVFNILSIP